MRARFENGQYGLTCGPELTELGFGGLIPTNLGQALTFAATLVLRNDADLGPAVRDAIGASSGRVTLQRISDDCGEITIWLSFP